MLILGEFAKRENERKFWLHEEDRKSLQKAQHQDNNLPMDKIIQNARVPYLQTWHINRDTNLPQQSNKNPHIYKHQIHNHIYKKTNSTTQTQKLSSFINLFRGQGQGSTMQGTSPWF